MINRAAMEGEKWRLLETAITKAKVILDGYSVREVFSTQEYVTNYDCVFLLCTNSWPNQIKLRDGFKRALEDSIVSKVLPSLMDKNGDPLLREFLRLWKNYKIMSKCLGGFFQYLDRGVSDKVEGPRLMDMSICCFHDMVTKVLHERLTNAAVFLISQDRHMIRIDQDLLQCFLRFYEETGVEGNIAYYAMFKAILEDAAIYYSRVATKWYPILSAASYVFKVEHCKFEEERRATKFLPQHSVERLLQVIQSEMLDKYAYILSEKRTAEDLNSMVYKVSAMRMEDV